MNERIKQTLMYKLRVIH